MNSFVGACASCASYLSSPNASARTEIQFVFDTKCQPEVGSASISTGLPFLAGAGNYENFRIAPDGLTYTQGNSFCTYIGDDRALLVHWIDEAEFGNLAQTAEAIYDRLLSQANALGFPYWVRVWNYFADINEEERGLERYRHFCKGRFEALTRHKIDERDYPSACALGHQGGKVLVYALVSRERPEHFENPRQLAAYHYPAEYGPRSPSFARASILRGAAGTASLFVSGTASVVGHETVCKDDLAGQVRTTLENIRELIAHVTSTSAYSKGVNWSANVLKVYVRHIKDVELIKHLIEQEYRDVPCVYVHADVCRADLLFEMDGIWNPAI